MKYIEIYDLNSCPVSERNGMYGGRSLKEGITIDGEYCIVKYFQGVSEYIGSGVYRIFGIDVQEVMLGVRNGRLVAACKDFCKHEGALREVRTLKNIHSKELSERLEKCSFTAPNAIEGMMIQLR
ncbi:MAG: hypothetical protein NC253_13075 [Ruminococcus sp.]|nr:hypothetical protein [Ruminococcus sp.]MCM1382658.1 hypothetical protein [Muribaculaceae bacterium]MCM1479741.1 hypothetical protein [Muribaculaceae bacterium]